MQAINIVKKGYNRVFSIYTKTSKVKGESWESGNYREIWGILKSETEFEIWLFSVIRDGCLSNRCRCSFGTDLKKKSIKIDPKTQLTIINHKRIFNK